MKKVFTPSLLPTEDNKIMPEFHKVDWDENYLFSPSLRMRGFNTLEKN